MNDFRHMSPISTRIVISLGGSLLVPDAIDTGFVKAFKKLIVGEVKAGKQFILITGGGKTARRYIEAAGNVSRITDDDRDWLGIHATRMNAHFIRTVFRAHAHPRINTNPHDLEDFYGAKEPILVAGGWRPGHSTDFDAVLLGKYLGAKKIINLSNIDYVYDRDPRQFPDARPFKSMDWKGFRKLVGNDWDPGMNAPFDPIAAKLAQEEGMEVIILNGQNLVNLSRSLEGRPFVGTVIKD
jgi:uridylate kinase